MSCLCEQKLYYDRMIHIYRTSDFFVLFSIFIISALVYLCWFFKKSHSFFNDKCFPTLEANFILGNLGDAILLRKPLAVTIYDLYEKLKPHKFSGLYLLHRPIVMLRDPEVIKNVLIRDFSYFPDRGISCDKEEEPLHNNLFRMRSDDDWRNMRMKLTPLFTSGKLKMIIGSIQECANKFSQILDETRNESFNMKELSERFSIDVIGNCALGMGTCALEDANCVFLRMARKIFKFRYQTLMRNFFPNLSKYWLKMLKLTYLDKNVEDFFLKTIRKVIEKRDEVNEPRKHDLLDFLLALRNKSTKYGVDLNQHKGTREDNDFENSSGIEMTTELVIAQCFLFFAAGFETSSSAFGYVMLELALNQSIQTKVREEILLVVGKNNGQITHESLKEMTYCDMVISETLRKHPPGGIIVRECSKNYQIPGTDTIIPENMSVWISTYGLHMDPEYYEKPNEFYPEHFTEVAKTKRPKCAYLPFGEGPRICIGERFAKLEIKIGMVSLIKDYVFEVSPKMKFPLEFKFDMFHGFLSVDEIWLQCRKI